MINNKLIIIIPTKNRRDELLDTIDSIGRQEVPPKQVLLIDQNESDEIKQTVVNRYIESVPIKVIHESGINGLAQARNAAINYTLENEFDFALFLDDDVILEENFVSEMLTAYRRREEIAGVGGVIANYPKYKHIKYFQSFFNREIFYDKRYVIYSRADEYSGLINSAFLPGGAMSFRKEVLSEFLFDSNYIGYSFGEDWEYTWRVSQKYKLVISTSAKLLHIRSKIGRFNFYKEYRARVISSFYMYKKHKNLLKTPKIDLTLNLCGLFLLVCAACVKKVTITPLLGFLSGISCAINNFRNAGFLIDNPKFVK